MITHARDTIIRIQSFHGRYGLSENQKIPFSVWLKTSISTMQPAVFSIPADECSIYICILLIL
jgi:hypothetical protein